MSESDARSRTQALYEAAAIVRAAYERVRVVEREEARRNPQLRGARWRALVVSAEAAGADPVRFAVELWMTADIAETWYTAAGKADAAEQAELEALELVAQAKEQPDWFARNRGTLATLPTPTWRALVRLGHLDSLVPEEERWYDAKRQ